jgi:hypothetical protein
MHKINGLMAGGIVLALLAATPAGAASLLGGLINTGTDSGNSNSLVSNNPDGSIGVGGSNGVSVNLGGLTGGGSGGGLLGGLTGSDGGSGGGGLVGSLTGGDGGLGGTVGGLTGGSGNIGVPGVADVSTSSGSGGGQVGVSLLGGGGGTLSTNPLGLLGNGGGLSVSLPGLGGLGGSSGTPGTPGAPGAPGTPGLPGGGGAPGFTGFGGGNGFNGFNGTSGFGGSNGGVVIPSNASSRLRSILAVLAQRDWIRMVNGRAICLANFGTAEISSMLPRRDWAGLNAALPQYAQDIATLRQLLANCRASSQRQALNVRDLNRVIGIDIARNGTPVLYML